MRVHLREKEISNGRVSLYLDFYPPIIHPTTGKPTRREFLNLHLVKNPRGIPEREQTLSGGKSLNSSMTNPKIC